MRVYEYAETRSLGNQQVLEAAQRLGISATSHASGLDPDDVTKLDEHFTDPGATKPAEGDKSEADADGSDAAADVTVGDRKPAGRTQPDTGGDDLLAELERLKSRNAELEKDLVAARDPARAAQAANEDRAFVDNPKHYKTFTVAAIAGPALGNMPLQRVEHACDESEAIRRVCTRRGLTSSENRFRVEFLEFSKEPPPPPMPKPAPRWVAPMSRELRRAAERESHAV